MYVYVSTYAFVTCMCAILSTEKVEIPTSRGLIRHVRLYCLSDKESQFKTISLKTIPPWTTQH